ncbi:MAG TPA: hypothetical protein VI933_04010 [archaeon]|nr:hypothetical protein [archaeon]
MTNEIQTAQATPSVAADGGRGDGDGKSVSSASTRKEEKFNFFKWVRGKNRQEFLENGSYVLMVVAAVLVSGGLLLGSFVPGIVIVASIGAFILLPGLVIYVISQLMLPDENKEGENK